MAEKLTCLVTVHGIGFQQPPTSLNTADGYADGLHECLRNSLGSALGDDPRRKRGPVYVASSYPLGLARLGTWDERKEKVDISDVALVGETGTIAHVALVYTGLQPTADDPVASLDAALLAFPSLPQYATAAGLIRTALRDVRAALHARPSSATAPPSSLRRRADIPVPGHHPVVTAMAGKVLSAIDPAAAAFMTTVRLIEDDVAAYVTRNEVRERVRGFVREALRRLVARDDVGTVVLNSHSNGTTIVFDVLSRLEEDSADKIKAFVTAGSPLRKYVDLFDWGTDAGLLAVDPWWNYWDRDDPVADPLQPGSGWLVGLPIPADGPGLFETWDDTGRTHRVRINDVEVDNISEVKAASGLPAHDYWANERFCQSLAAVVQDPTDQSGPSHARVVTV